MSSHDKPKDSAASESSNSIIVTKMSKSLNLHCRFFRRFCFTTSGRDDGGFFWSSGGILYAGSEFILTHHAERCAAVQSKLSIFMFAI